MRCGLRAKDWKNGFIQKSAGEAGRLIQDKRFVGVGRELADSAVGSEVCLAVT
jgi:hypothetical protein